MPPHERVVDHCMSMVIEEIRKFLKEKKKKEGKRKEKDKR
jgi:hypothetical protein